MVYSRISLYNSKTLLRHPEHDARLLAGDSLENRMLIEESGLL